MTAKKKNVFVNTWIVHVNTWIVHGMQLILFLKNLVIPFLINTKYPPSSH
jgi:hypothetical protein